MHVRFKDDRLRKLCEQERVMVQEMGKASARKLRARLEDLASATNVHELVAGRPHPLKGARAGQFSLTLSGGHRLVFEPTQQPPPERDGGGIEWGSVDEVTIVFIGDYHD